MCAVNPADLGAVVLSAGPRSPSIAKSGPTGVLVPVLFRFLVVMGSWLFEAVKINKVSSRDADDE